MPGVSFALSSAQTTGDTRPYPGGPGRAPISFAWETVTTMDMDTMRRILQRDAPWIGIERVTTEEVAGLIMDLLQSEIDRMSLVSEEDRLEYRRKCVRCLRGLGKHFEIVPSLLYIKKSFVKDVEFWGFGGAFSDIHLGRIINHPYPVCLKQLRIHDGGHYKRENVHKAFCHEAFIWRQLHHDNILPFYGVSDDIFPDGLCLISPWVAHGNVNAYLQNHPKHDRRGWVWDIAAGLSYLHGLDPCIVHKDIRGANILVGSDLRCLIADFGISLVVETQMPSSTSRGRGNTRWLAPEVLQHSESDVDVLPKADIYSFGCTIIEMYTGKPPHATVRTDAAVAFLVAQRTLPLQPPDDIIPSELWSQVVANCLAREPLERPSADRILQILLEMDETYFKQYSDAHRGSLPECPSTLPAFRSSDSDREHVELNGPTNDYHLDVAATNANGHHSSQKGASFPASSYPGEDTWMDDHIGQEEEWHRDGHVNQDWANLQDLHALDDMMGRDTPWKGIQWVKAEFAPVVMDKLQSEIDDKLSPNELESRDESREKYVKCLLRLGKTYDILPSQLYISKDAIKSRDDHSICGGSFSDVYRGEIHGYTGPVCLKALRFHKKRGKTYQEKVSRMKKRFCREALSWRQLWHENILPFYGVSEEMFGNHQLCFISPWLENGTVVDYLEDHQEHDRRGWVWDVSAALSYLHQLDPCIAHTGIRGGNLLVGDDFRCYIADLGDSVVSDTERRGTGSRFAGKINWSPPEVLNGSCNYNVKELVKVDIYSFGCTIVEMYTRSPLYIHLQSLDVIKEVLQMKLPSPPPPDVLPSELLDMVVAKALSPLPEGRPSATEIKAALEAMYPEYLEKYRKESRTKPLKSVLHWRTTTSTP